ncbi:cytochrome c-type biogenesis protein [Roseinatronobacter alkalisoli]|uniref:Cytochrome c-type biogenesis protein n=1 Tax=Roseinatronobacter alkalisoli TaxID=3028235 RepID=A0ABT5T3M4_9RHOB|nr:cytochrome c-type biogenesis protein [Roseinatronobacter sp. HJB301]MDD7969715.1 cytochrome c-type biogenesis protein CcmH [Roseinatronobacter sp. HJB301]
MNGIRTILAVLCIAFASTALAVQPDEILDDPVLESRARDISAGLRCLVCRNESIDESNADLARDMRLLVRERLVEGDSDDAVIAFIVERYGEYVLLRPTTDGANIILWVAAPVLFLIALSSALVYLRRRDKAPEPEKAGLSVEEKRRLQELLKE